MGTSNNYTNVELFTIFRKLEYVTICHALKFQQSVYCISITLDKIHNNYSI